MAKVTLTNPIAGKAIASVRIASIGVNIEDPANPHVILTALYFFDDGTRAPIPDGRRSSVDVSGDAARQFLAGMTQPFQNAAEQALNAYDLLTSRANAFAQQIGFIPGGADAAE